MLGVAKKIFLGPPNSSDELGGFYYIKTINSNNIKRKIIITKDKIKKSFLFINIASLHYLSNKVWLHPTN